MPITRPMLAGTLLDLQKVDFTQKNVWVSPKLDGIRCLVHPVHGPVTRNFKPIPNLHIREALSDPRYLGLDGELMLAGDEDFNSVQSAVMTHAGAPDFRLVCFDRFLRPESPWIDRFCDLLDDKSKFEDNIEVLEHKSCASLQELETLELEAIGYGFEGIMLRNSGMPYKSGRSTVREGGLLKFKRFHDAEGVVTGFDERMHNANEATTGVFGNTERTSHKENMEPAGTLGTLILHTKDWGVVRVGTGFDDALRLEIWENKEAYRGTTVKFKYQHVPKDKPRFPVFLGFVE